MARCSQVPTMAAAAPLPVQPAAAACFATLEMRRIAEASHTRAVSFGGTSGMGGGGGAQQRFQLCPSLLRSSAPATRLP